MYRDDARPTFTHTTDWKLPLNLAIGFHVLVALSAIFLPGLFNIRPKFEDIYTVDLVSMAEPAPPAAAPPAAAKPAAAKPAVAKPAAVKPPPEPPPPEPVPDKAVPVPEASAPVETPAPPEAISIKPLKRKVKKEVPPEEPKPEPTKPKEPEAKPDPKQKEMDKLKRQKIAEAIRAEQEAADEAQIAKEEAEQLRKMLDASQAKATSQASGSTSSKATGSAKASNASSALEKSYYAAIFSRLHAFWALPEFREWDPNLTAVVVITINQNGEILDSFFEQSSGDKVFDQYVTKTLQDAAPLPPIPAALNKERLELGLRFTPGNIQ